MTTLAYLASSSATKEKSFITLTPGVGFVNPFSLLTKGKIGHRLSLACVIFGSSARD
jgi:hypothetical protein